MGGAPPRIGLDISAVRGITELTCALAEPVLWLFHGGRLRRWIKPAVINLTLSRGFVLGRVLF